MSDTRSGPPSYSEEDSTLVGGGFPFPPFLVAGRVAAFGFVVLSLGWVGPGPPATMRASSKISLLGTISLGLGLSAPFGPFSLAVPDGPFFEVEQALSLDESMARPPWSFCFFLGGPAW